MPQLNPVFLTEITNLTPVTNNYIALSIGQYHELGYVVNRLHKIDTVTQRRSLASIQKQQY